MVSKRFNRGNPLEILFSHFMKLAISKAVRDKKSPAFLLISMFLFDVLEDLTFNLLMYLPKTNLFLWLVFINNQDLRL